MLTKLPWPADKDGDQRGRIKLAKELKRNAIERAGGEDNYRKRPKYMPTE